MPLTAPLQQLPFPSASFSHRRERATPGRYRVRLGTGIDVDLTDDEAHRLRHLPLPEAHRLPRVRRRRRRDRPEQRLGRRSRAETDRRLGDRRRLLRRPRLAHDVLRGPSSTVDDRLVSGPGPRTARPAERRRSRRQHRRWRARRLQPSAGRTLRRAVGISYVDDAAGAEANLAAEGARPGTATWSRRGRGRCGTARSGASRSRAAPPDSARRSRRALPLAHPPFALERRRRRYRGRDGASRRRRGYPRYTNISGWDTYRTQFPLLALLEPRVASDVARSLVDGAAESGSLAKWELGGRRVRDHGRRPDAAPDRRGVGLRRAPLRPGRGVRCDGTCRPRAARRARSSTRATRRRWTARAGGAFVPRPGLDAYVSLGYVPLDHGAGFIWGPAATTLEYALADFALGRFASAAGRVRRRPFARAVGELASALQPGDGLSRATRSPTAPSSPALAHHRERLRRGELERSTRGSSRTTSPGSPPARRRPSGRDSPRPLPCRPRREPPGAARLARERAELRDALALRLAGAPWRTQAVVRRAVTTLFRPLPAGLPGDDDLGALSSWYVWSALGLYPAIPGVGGLAVASPLFPSVTIASGLGRLRARRAPRLADGVCSRPEARRRSATNAPGRRSGSARRENAALRASARAGSELGNGAPRAGRHRFRAARDGRAAGALVARARSRSLESGSRSRSWRSHPRDTTCRGCRGTAMRRSNGDVVRVPRGRPRSDLGGRRSACPCRGRSRTPLSLRPPSTHGRTWRTPRRWPGLLIGGGAVALTAAAVVHEMTPPGWRRVGWPLLWSIPLAPYRLVADPSVDVAFAFGLVLSLLAIAATVVATAYIGALRQRAPVGRAPGGRAVHGLAVPRPGGRRRECVGERAVACRRRPPPVHRALSTALVSVGLALVLRSSGNLAVSVAAGHLLGFATAVKLSNGLIGAALAAAIVARSGTQVRPRLRGPPAPVGSRWWRSTGPKGYPDIYEAERCRLHTRGARQRDRRVDRLARLHARVHLRARRSWRRWSRRAPQAASSRLTLAAPIARDRVPSTASTASRRSTRASSTRSSRRSGPRRGRPLALARRLGRRRGVLRA